MFCCCLKQRRLSYQLEYFTFVGALCHFELKHFSEAMTWCDEGLRIDPKEKKLLETRTKADRLKVREKEKKRYDLCRLRLWECSSAFEVLIKLCQSCSVLKKEI